MRKNESARAAKSRLLSLFTWVPFTVVSVSSEMQGTSADDLARHQNFQPQQHTWECARYCSYPQEIIIRLNYRSEVAHLILMAKEDRYIPEVEVYVGDGLSGSFLDVEYRRAGTGFNIVHASK